MAAKTYTVVAPAAVVRLGGTERYLYRGATVPAGVSAADLERLTRRGLIAPTAHTPPPVAAESSGDGGGGSESGSGADPDGDQGQDEGGEPKPARTRASARKNDD